MITNQVDGNQVNEYKDLCQSADAIAKNKFGAKAPQGYEVADSKFDKNSNFKGVLYKKGDQYIFCFVGTERTSRKDHAANLKMGLMGENQQMLQANDYFKELMKTRGINTNNVTLIGHSEGGTEATFVGVNNNVKTVTFNTYGISKKLVDKNKNYNDLVINIRNEHDPVSKMKSNIGKTFIVPSTQNAVLGKTPFVAVKSHSIKNMGDCNKSVHVEEFKKKNPFFLDKLSEAEITKEDIGNMENELYQTYELEINERMQKNEIISRSEANQKVNADGMIYV